VVNSSTTTEARLTGIIGEGNFGGFYLKLFDQRSYRYKNPAMEFYCPLCRTQRAFAYSPKLKVRHYLQIAVIGSLLTALAYPLMGPRGLIVFFPVWAAFYAGLRMLFRKEIPCPHCGFDASWYKRDVKVARKLVKEFWQTQPPTEKAAKQTSQTL
jgi:hypothetical protein